MRQANQIDRIFVQHPKGPLTPYVDAFTRQLEEQGYRPSVIARQTKAVLDFSGWVVDQERVGSAACTSQHIERYLRWLSRHRPRRHGIAHTLREFLRLLCQQGLIVDPTASFPATPIDRVIADYSRYLRQERNLSPATSAIYLPFVRCFLSAHFGQDPINFLVLSPANVIEFIRRQAVQHIPSVAKNATSALRSFLRYLRYRGAINIDLAAAVPTVASWALVGIPRAIHADHARAALAHCRRDTPVGCRDYAILLLLARLGLRAGEIVSLTLDDIDWQSGNLTVTGKRRQPEPLPLPREVGEAIVLYLQHGRPKSIDRTLFLRARAPIRRLHGSSAIGSVVRLALARASIDCPHRGTHQFRHALACEMLRQGATLTEIGALLRHRSPQTTALYAKCDLLALRTLSLSWPGGAQ
ncbi:MAG TPA: site-specific integrase [Rhizobacter sp.]|nr:site-specific integrase [Rhizobacter sp.]